MNLSGGTAYFDQVQRQPQILRVPDSGPIAPSLPSIGTAAVQTLGLRRGFPDWVLRWVLSPPALSLNRRPMSGCHSAAGLQCCDWSSGSQSWPLNDLYSSLSLANFQLYSLAKATVDSRLRRNVPSLCIREFLCPRSAAWPALH